MKFEFAQTEEEADALADPGKGTEEERTSQEKRPPHPSARITAASERLRTRARFDFDRVHLSLNRMLHTVEASRPHTAPAAAPEDQEPEMFRPEAFGPHTTGEPRE